MDLWQALARLKERPIALIGIVVLALGLGIFGWLATTPSYTVSSSQALQSSAKSDGSDSMGSYESGVVATMVAQNASGLGSDGVSGGTLTATNTVVNPPLALPLISMTATADSPDGALKILNDARAANTDFLKLVGGPKVSSGQLQLVDTVQNPQPTKSSQPRIRAAGAGFLLGAFGGVLVLLVIDVLMRRRTTVSRPKHEATALDSRQDDVRTSSRA